MSARTAHMDSVYWARLKTGDSQALGYLYDQYSDKIFMSALRLSADRDLAKDVLQEVFIEIWNYRNTLADVHYVQGYLLRVMRNIMVRKLKKNQLVLHMDLQDSIHSSAESIESLLISADADREKLSRLQRAVATLTRRQQQILQMRFYEGLNYEQIAEKLNMNYQSVNNLVFRTINRLRSELLLLFIMMLLSFYR